jgi:3-dehydroquinate synthase
MAHCSILPPCFDFRYNFAVPTVPVNIPGASYNIEIRPGLLREIGNQISTLTRSRKVCIVTDSLVGPLYVHVVEEGLRESAFTVISAHIPTGEDHKTFASIDAIYEQLLPARLDRQTPIIALGGGVIGDMTGFVAATILRGVPFIQVPTTLLAMVDASVGGKTGINHRVGKNLIGAFHQPIAVLIDPEVLKTLPARELKGGLAECIKHDIIRDVEGFARLEHSIERAIALDIPYLTDLVAHNVAIKAAVVAADPFEKAERAHLNFGHTFGHAFENVTNYAISHGEAVAIGMVAASRLAQNLGMLDKSSVGRIINLIGRAGLPISGAPADTIALLESMKFDKKVHGGKLRLILPDRIGHVLMRDDVPIDAVRDAIQSVQGGR